MRIIIDGNIGSGKSTLIDFLKKDYKHVYPEPIGEWKSWLHKYYQDMKKNALGFQLKVLKTHIDRSKYIHGIFERSPLSCQKVFGELLFEDNLINELEFDLCEDFYQSFGWSPDIVIYLRCSPETCYNRMKERNRESEDQIPLDYLKKIDNKYEKLYTNKQNVIIIDGEDNTEKIYQDVKQSLKKYLA